MDPEVEKIIEKIRSLREEKGISTLQLSVDSGISRNHLFYIESKRTIPNLETLSKIAKAMGLELRDFFV